MNDFYEPNEEVYYHEGHDKLPVHIKIIAIILVISIIWISFAF